MAQPSKRMLSQVLGQITELPGAHQALDVVNGLRDRIDELQKGLRGLDALEERIATLERRLDELTKDERPEPASTGRAGAKKPTTSGAKRTASAVKRSASDPEASGNS